MSMPGAPGESQQPEQLDADGQAALAFALAHLNGAGNLVSFKTQVVAGTNYIFQLSGLESTVTVWSQTWTGLLQLTKPDGTTVSNQA